MDNNISQQQMSQAPQTQESFQNNSLPITPNSTSKSRNIIFAIVGIVLVLLIGLGGFLFFKQKPDRYTFRIDNQEIMKNQFQPVYSYYRTQSGNTPENALTFTKNLFIENHILKKEYFAKGHTQQELDQNTQTIQKSSDLPKEAQQLISENTIMKEQILSGIGVNLRSGEFLKISSSGSLSPTELQNLQSLAMQKVTFYKNQYDSGISFNQVKQNFLADTELKSQTRLRADILYFTDISSTRSIIPDKTFTDIVFATGVNKVSPVINLGNASQIYVGVVHITQASDGNSVNYQDWLDKKIKEIKIVTDFSGL